MTGNSVLGDVMAWLSVLFSRYCRCCFFFFFSSRRRHTRSYGDWSSDVCSSDLIRPPPRLCNRTFISAPLPGRLEDHSVLLGALMLRHRAEQVAAVGDELRAGREADRKSVV